VAERVGFHGGNRNSLRQKAALGATSRTRWIGQDRPGRVPPSAPEARGDGSMNRPLVAFGLPRPLPALPVGPLQPRRAPPLTGAGGAPSPTAAGSGARGPAGASPRRSPARRDRSRPAPPVPPPGP